MSTTELERRLGEVLRQHAEDAMNRTDTQGQLETLRTGLDPDRQQRRRLAWAGGALAVAASVAVAVLLVSNLGNDTPDIGTPARPPDASPVDVATDFLDAFAAYDVERAGSYLAEGGTVLLWTSAPEEGSLVDEVRWSEAAGVELLTGSCEESPTAPDGATVVCPFAFHALGSAELDRGPFSDNEFRLTIVDGKIVTADTVVTYETNGLSDQMWEPFARWVAETHPDDAAHMYKDWPGQTLQATNQRSADLWAQHVAGYVKAVQQGKAV